MIVTGFDNKTYKLNLSHKYNRKFNFCKSKYHILARELLTKIFPNFSFYEEVTLSGTGKPPLYADFLCPQLRLMVEVHGQQHYTYCHHFHKSKQDFYEASKRDKLKKEWCKKNNIYLVILKYDETEIWEEKLKGFNNA